MTTAALVSPVRPPAVVLTAPPLLISSWLPTPTTVIAPFVAADEMNPLVLILRTVPAAALSVLKLGATIVES
jgi:hypothetical protein